LVKRNVKERDRLRWEDNIKTDLTDTGWEVGRLYSSFLLAESCEHGNEAVDSKKEKSGNFLSD
jgi:hypothetical protein